MLEVGQKIPDFKTVDDQGNEINSQELFTQKTVLYFYPKDMTPGCTTQACDFTENIKKFEKEGYQVIGVSKDPVKSHQKFKEKHSIPFKLLSDESVELNKLFDVWKEKSLYGKKYMGTERSTFIIDDGKVVKKYPKVKVKGHVEQVLNDIQEL